MDNGTRLLVLSVLEGRHFPTRQFTNIVVDAKFDGESLSSDPISHVSNPSFNVELAWEVDRRSLHELHIKRTPVKLQAYAINSKTGGRESIGYIVLDSRQAHNEIEKAKPKWYPLLNCKYHPRPELLMCLGLDKYVPQAKSQPPKALSIENLQMTDDEQIQATLRDDGFYQIGPAATCTDAFVFSVTVGFAANLQNLLPTSRHLLDGNRGYFFYYSLLGNDIVTDEFYDLNLSDFSPERASIKLRSSLAILRTFFLNQSSIQVHLCRGEQSLGSAVVPLSDFIKQEDIKDQFALPINMEDCYEIKTSRHSQLETFSESMKPIVGIAISLNVETGIIQKEEVAQVEPTPLNMPVESKREEIKVQMSSPEKLSKIPTSDAKTSPTKVQSATEIKPSIIEAQSTVKSKGSPQKVEPSITHDIPTTQKQKLYSYELTIDLKSIRNTGNSLIYATVRYSWPYFGNVAPISTDPAVYVTPDTECNLPQGNTTVSFATHPTQMKTIFTGSPIPVELVDRESVVDRETVIGKGAIVLSPLISRNSASVVNEIGKKVQRWTHSQAVSIDDLHGLKVADLRVDLVLDDLGLFESNELDYPSRDKETTKYELLRRSKEIDPDIAERVALELEQWKEWQEAVFTTKLKEKEKQHMETLASAWTQKETERETLFKKRLTEYNELEEQLKSALNAVEKRERQLQAGEAELQRVKADLQSEYDRLVQEVKDVSRRVKEECAHRNELERNKAKALQDQCLKWQRQVTELEKKLELREAEFQAYREQKERPEIRLQAQINVLNLEKSELERKNSSLLKSKVHYKQQYGKCLKELARLKQAMQLEAHAQLREKKKELILMKMGLEKQINQHQHENRPLGSDTDKLSGTESNDVLAAGIAHGVEQSCLTHLLNEKDELLQTGLYRPDDAVITQLDKEIQIVLNKMER